MTPEKIAARLHSFLKSEMGRARRQLQKAGHQNAGAPVHDTRKTIKKLRAALRLAGTMTEPGPLKTAAVPLREAAHRLGPLRDALVLEATAEKLVQAGETPLPSPLAPPAAALLREARAHLRSAELALQRILKGELDPKGVKDGLRLLYRRAQRAMRRADKDTSDEALHAWRRRTKDFFYNLELTGAPAGYTRKIKRLTEFLGDDHDLAFFGRHYASPDGLKAHRPLFKRLKAKRGRLQEKAFHLGSRLFDEKPGKMAARLAG